MNVYIADPLQVKALERQHGITLTSWHLDLARNNGGNVVVDPVDLRGNPRQVQFKLELLRFPDDVIAEDFEKSDDIWFSWRTR